jgi:DNA-3-methyladenine glycosylase
MFGPPGHAYVYLVYGMYHCLNVVTEPAGSAAACLIRAVEPVDGIDQMRRARAAYARGRRSSDRSAPSGPGHATVPDVALASGPGLVCVAFSIERPLNGVDMCDPTSPLHLEPAPAGESLAVEAGPRVGIGYAGEPWRSVPWRFWIAGSRAVSGPRRVRQ